jgi:predicted metal-dependent peptidase
MSDADKRQLEQEIDQAIRQGALTAGKMGADMPRGFEQLLQPQIDWREVMREFVSATCTGKDYSTYNRPNRRFMSAGMYMPSAVSEQVGELVVAIDTSYSIGDTELAAFLSELKAICDTVNPTSVRLLYWGHEVVGDEKYGEMDTPIDQLVTSTKPQGGGGTDVNCVCDYIREKNINAEAVVVLTDGHLAGDWGTWTQPLLWCILDNKNASPSVGKYVHIKL